jgi:hypothetical protein
MDDTTPVNQCRTGCPTPGALKWVAYCNSANGYDYSKQKRWDNELASYRSARASGVEPSWHHAEGDRQGSTALAISRARHSEA